MAGRLRWHWPIGLKDWLLFATCVLFFGFGVIALFAQPVGSRHWWFGLGGIVLGSLGALGIALEPLEMSDRVTFDDDKVVRTLPDGRVETVRWDDLQQIAIMTTGEGPIADDVFFMLHGKQSGCAVPQSADGADALLARLQQLPGFNNAAVVEAMSATTDATFVCWKRSG